MATPIEHAWREFAFYLRGPAGLNTYAFATKDDYRAGVQHVGLIATVPSLTESAPDDFGFMAEGSFDVEIFDEATDDDWPVLDEAGDFIQSEDGTGYLIQEY